VPCRIWTEGATADAPPTGALACIPKDFPCRRAAVHRASRAPPLLARFEPKDGNTTANRLCLQAIVAPTGVDLLRKPINTFVVVGVGDLSRQKFLATQFAFRVRLEVVVPLRVFRSAVALTRWPSWRQSQSSRTPSADFGRQPARA
jgi:hypothetical protein